MQGPQRVAGMSNRCALARVHEYCSITPCPQEAIVLLAQGQVSRAGAL